MTDNSVSDSCMNHNHVIISSGFKEMDPGVALQQEQGGGAEQAGELLPEGHGHVEAAAAEAVMNIADSDPTKRVKFGRFQNRMMRFVWYFQLKFEKHGQKVGKYPCSYIIVTSLVVLLSWLGLLSFRQERNPLRLWIPQQSDFFTDTNWLMDNYGEGLRMQSILITAPDVLQKEVLLKLLEIHTDLTNSSVPVASWQDICFKVPVISFNVGGPRLRREVNGKGMISEFLDAAFKQSSNNDFAIMKSSTQSIQQMLINETFDPSILFGNTLYCSIVKNMPLDCLQQNILDLWKYDSDQINNLTQSEIVRDLNSTTFSPTLGHPIPFKTLLGGITYDTNGKIMSARALLSLYMVHVNFSTVDMDEVGNEGGTADWANGPGLEWESKFLEIMDRASKQSSGIEIYYEAGRSFGDISASGMFQDVDKLMIGIVMMLVYIQLQQTRLSCVDSRIIPNMVGLLCVGLSFVTSIAVCSLIGIPYGPVHTSLPFLLMGIGVDDMFVILSCLNSVPAEEKLQPMFKRIGTTMHHAGLSITITSVTDFLAFLIGSTTILPSLHSFCIYAAIGVFVTFCLQCTLFVAFLAMDQKRMQAGKNCLFPWIQQAQPKPVDLSYVPHCSRVLKFIYSNVVITKVGKYFTVVITVALMAVAFLGAMNVRQEFRPEWFLDQDSYLYKFLGKRNEFFPDFGNSAGVYLGQLHYSEELQNIGRLVQQLQNRSDVLKNVEDWWGGFQRYVNIHFKKDIQVDILSDDDFNHYLSQYLFSPSGGRFQKNFRFSEPLECGKPAPNITVASIEFYFKKFEDSAQSVSAMNTVKDLVKNANFTSGDRFATVWAKVFANWVTDEVIGHELMRNIMMAVVVVAFTTVLFLGSLSASSWVLLCVVLTLLDTIGFMHFWGLTIDLVSAIALVLAVGLCVDYAAHIAYAFMTIEGSLDERATFAVTHIGGAVLHGGTTTLLALSVLVISRSYIFTAFFKIFFMVVVFGLFHGLVFLPVILSLLGPMPYPVSRRKCDFRDELYNVEVAHEPQELPSPYDPPTFEARGL